MGMAILDPHCHGHHSASSEWSLFFLPSYCSLHTSRGQTVCQTMTHHSEGPAISALGAWGRTGQEHWCRKQQPRGSGVSLAPVLFAPRERESRCGQGREVAGRLPLHGNAQAPSLSPLGRSQNSSLPWVSREGKHCPLFISFPASIHALGRGSQYLLVEKRGSWMPKMLQYFQGS